MDATLHIVQPETLLRWHRDLFHFNWQRKSKTEKREPRISPETIELLKLGIKVSKRTVQKFMLKVCHNRSGQTWVTLLHLDCLHALPVQGLALPTKTIGEACHGQAQALIQTLILHTHHLMEQDVKVQVVFDNLFAKQTPFVSAIAF